MSFFRKPYLFCVLWALLGLASSLVAQVVVVNTDTLISTQAGASVYTIENFTIDGGEKLVVSAGAEGRGGSATITSITFDGVELTQAATVADSAQASQFAAVWYLDSPAAALGDIVVTWSGATNGCGVAAYSLIGTLSGPPSVVATNDSGTSLSLTTTSDNTFVVASFVANGGPAVTVEDPLQLTIEGDIGSARGGFATTNIPDAGSVDVTFAGGGSRPVVAAVGIELALPNSDPNALVAPSSLFGDFSDEEPGFLPFAESLLIRNNAFTNNLEVTSVVITGADAASYTLQSVTFPVSLAPGEALMLEVEIDNSRDGAVGGTFTAQAVITTNDPDTPEITVDLSAFIVTDPELRVVAPAQLFGTIPIDAAETSITRSLTVENLGISEDLDLTSEIVGVDAAAFTIIDAPDTLEAEGGPEEIIIELNRGSQTSFSATLQLTSNDPDAGTIEIPLDAELLVDVVSLIVVSSGDGAETRAFLDEQVNADLITVGLFANMTLDNNADELEQLNSADLIIFERLTSSPNYRDSDEVEFWNAVTTPIIQTNPFISRQDRWGWGGTSLNNNTAGVTVNLVAGAESTVVSTGTARLGLAEGSYDFLLDSAPNAGATMASTNLGEGILLAEGLVPAPGSTEGEFGLPSTQSAYWPAGSLNRAGDTMSGDRYFFGLADTGALALNANLTIEGTNALLNLIGSTSERIEVTPVVADSLVEVQSIVRNADDTVTLTFTSDAGASYTLRTRETLDVAISTWAADQTDIAASGTGQTTVTTVSAYPENVRFFAIERQ